METSIQTPRNLMAFALRNSMSAMESLWQGSKQLLHRRNISLSDMGDMLGGFFYFIFASTYRSHLYPSISPGRFFAVNEVKALLAHVLVTYDIKFEEGKQAPRAVNFDARRIPGKANVMFRKRQK
jgi:hypothetical protein